MAAVQYPAFNHFDAARRGFLAERLTPAQRALAELCADRPWLSLLTPWPRWCVRRWLGLDPPGALEQLVTHEVDGQTETSPRWRGFDAVRGRPDETQRLLEALPMRDRLEVYGELYAGAYDLGGFRVADESLPDFPGLEALRDEGREWAPRYADAWLARAKTDTTNQTNPIHYAKIRRPLLLSLVRARVPVERRWEVFLPADPPELQYECLDWLAEPRRGPALGASLPYGPLEEQVARLLALLERYPFPGLIDVIFDRHRQNYPSPKKVSKATLTKLEPLVKRHPALAEAILANENRKPIKLTARPLPLPAEASLTPLQQQQIAALDGGTFELPGALRAVERRRDTALRRGDSRRRRPGIPARDRRADRDDRRGKRRRRRRGPVPRPRQGPGDSPEEATEKVKPAP